VWSLVSFHFIFFSPPPHFSFQGDITGDETWYHTAWRISNNRFSRAARSIGGRRVDEEKWDEGMMENNSGTM
jgi:hypothetical protein